MDEARSEDSGGSGRTDQPTTRVHSHPTAIDGVPHVVHDVGQVGRYVSLEEIGRGGMGRVLRAYDPKLQREVALKQLRENALGDDGSRRLVREARAMAKLAHANVVAVFDVEAREDGGLVIVMEYVRGQTLRAWLRDERRDWPAILACFTAAGHGLCAAHDAGLLHRDFKPSNVLVGDDGVVKVTDFGLARGTGEPASHPGSSPEPHTDPDSCSLTRTGVLVGTPRYMAPEQEPGHVLTAAADQYAFCVALWEALCGHSPFHGKDMAAQKRSGPPPWTNHDVPRRVAAAIVRGLDPEPGRRWPDMSALLAALDHQPGRRRSRLLAAAGGLAIVGLGGAQAWAATNDEACTGAEAALGNAWDDARKSEVRDAMLAVDAPFTEAAWERTRSTLDSYAGQWVQMHVESCEATTLRGEQSPAVMDLRFACLSRAKTELDSVAGVLAAADRQAVRKAHVLTGGLMELSRCADVEALQADVEPPRASEKRHVATIRALLATAKAQTEAGHYDAAQTTVDEATALLEGLEYGPVQTEVAMQVARTLERRGEYDAAEAALLDATTLATRWQQWGELQAATTQLLFVVGARLQRPEALRYREMALGLAWGDKKREAAARGNLGLALDYAMGHYPEAEAEYRHALALTQDAFGADHPAVAQVRGNLAGVLQAQGKFADAEAEHRRALATRERALGKTHPDVAASHNGVAIALYQRGAYQEAEAEHRLALALRIEGLGPEHPDVAQSHNNLGVVLTEQGRYTDARDHHRRALRLREHALGPRHPEVAKSINNLASTLFSLEDYDGAIDLFRRALALRERALGSDHPDVATGRNNLAHVLLKVGRTDEAVALAEQAWRRRSEPGIAPGRRADTAFVLAQALWDASAQLADRDRARVLAETATEAYAEAGEADGNAAHRLAAWRAAHR